MNVNQKQGLEFGLGFVLLLLLVFSGRFVMHLSHLCFENYVDFTDVCIRKSEHIPCVFCRHFSEFENAIPIFIVPFKWPENHTRNSKLISIYIYFGYKLYNFFDMPSAMTLYFIRATYVYLYMSNSRREHTRDLWFLVAVCMFVWQIPSAFRSTNACVNLIKCVMDREFSEYVYAEDACLNMSFTNHCNNRITFSLHFTPSAQHHYYYCHWTPATKLYNKRTCTIHCVVILLI